MNNNVANRPNVLFIMADQFRTASLTGQGDGIETPNIDRIRRESVFFTKAACTAPLCTPSRASLATGKMPHNCGVMVHDANLPLGQTTYYQRLRRAGYRVAVTGKTDLHKKDPTLGTNGPLPVSYELGFTDPTGETEGKMNSVWYGVKKDGITRSVLQAVQSRKPIDGEIVPLGPYQKYLMERSPEKMQTLCSDYINRLGLKPKYYASPTNLDAEEYIDNFVGRLACDWLENVDDEAPWHLFVSFPGPHNPWDPPKEEVEKLQGKSYPQTPADDLEGKPEWVKKRAARESAGITSEAHDNMKRHYDASIQVIDRQIGNLLDILKRRGLDENTIVIFSADHGELMGDHGLFEKQSMYEGSLRVPLLIHLPGMTRERKSTALASLMDLAPTILDLCGADYYAADMDGRSLVPILTEQEEEVRHVQESELRHTAMLYDGRYKWIRNVNDSNELYDLDADPDELHNILKEHPEVIARLQQHTYRQ
ncbi:MAG: sulfatase [Faecousia sp.]